jgi:hypothetical protein
MGCWAFLGNIFGFLSSLKAIQRVPTISDCVDVQYCLLAWSVHIGSLQNQCVRPEIMGNKYYRGRTKSRKKRYTSRKKREQPSVHTGAEEETEQQEQEEQETIEVNGGDAELCEISGVQDPLETQLSPVRSESSKRTSSVQESVVESPQFELRQVATVESNSHANPSTTSPNTSSVSQTFSLLCVCCVCVFGPYIICLYHVRLVRLVRCG